jgi:hypothetical protein
MSVGQKRGGKSVSTRIFVTTLVALLTVSAIVGYLSYLTTTKLQLDQSALQDDFRDLSSRMAGFQAELNESQNNNNETQTEFVELQSQFSNLQSRYDSLQTEYTTLKSNHSGLQSQYNTIQSQYSTLQGSFIKFVADYQTTRTLEAYNYLVFSDGRGNYYAENGATGAIDYSGTSGTEVGQNCITALSSSGGKIVFAGAINLDGPLIIQNGASNGRLEISGFGSSSQFIISQNNDGIHILGNQAFGYGGPYHVTIKDLVLTSATTRVGRFINNGIYIKNWFGVDVKDVMIFNANNSGVLIEDSADVQLDNVYVEGGSGTEYGGSEPLTGAGIWLKGSKDCYFHNCYSDTNYDGFRIDSASQKGDMPRSIFLTQCEATLSQHFGILISRADGIMLSDSLIEGSNEDGIVIVDSFRINVANTLVIGNVGNGILINSQSLNMTQSEILINDCTIKSNNQNGIKIWAQYNMPISQVSIQECNIILSGTGARGNPNQPNIWDSVFISNDAITGGTCKYIKITSCFLGNIAGATPTQMYGIRSLQNSDYVQVFHNNFFQNLAGNYSLAGAHNSVGDNYDE